VFSHVIDTLDQSKNSANDPMGADVRKRAEQIYVESGLAELGPALRKQLIKFNENIPVRAETHADTEAFMEELKRYLEDPAWFVVVDASIGSLAQAMINAGLVRPPKRAISNANEAALGTGFVARLPAFPPAPMDELLDLREVLDEPLGRYRRKVSPASSMAAGCELD
jgi:hypothetical protein